jgi:hypothetical protein
MTPVCRISVKPGPPGVSAAHPLRGRKRTSKRHNTMSESCRFLTVATQQTALFDDVVGDGE